MSRTFLLAKQLGSSYDPVRSAMPAIRYVSAAIGRKRETRRSTMKPTKTTTPLRDRCLSHCAILGIPLEGAWLDELLSRAEKESLSLSALSRSAAGGTGRRAPGTHRRAAHSASPFCGPQDLGRVQLAVQPQSLRPRADRRTGRSEEHTSERLSPCNLVCRLL